MREPVPIRLAEPSVPEHASRYEALRTHTLEQHRVPAARDGLAVLLRGGVAAWMDAWSRVPTPAVRTTEDHRHRPSLPDGASAEVIRVLAAMALGHIQEVHA